MKDPIGQLFQFPTQEEKRTNATHFSTGSVPYGNPVTRYTIYPYLSASFIDHSVTLFQYFPQTFDEQHTTEMFE